MSQLEAYRDAVRRRIEERAEAALNNLGAVRWRPAQVASPISKAGQPANPVTLPSLSAEDIALAHTLHQAEAQVLTEIKTYLDEEYRKAMGQPAEANDPGKTARIGKQTVEQKKGIYG